MAPAFELNLDARNVQTGTGATLSLKPAIQFSEVRPERPADAGAIANGQAVTTAGLTHYLESPSVLGQMGWVRTGIAYWLSAAGTVSFGRAEGVVHCTWRTLGWVGQPELLVVNPTNDNNEWNIFPLFRGRNIPLRGVDKLGAMVIGEGNLNTDLEYWLAARVFKDPMARGAWSIMDGTPQNPSTSNFETNLGELVFPQALDLANSMWVEAGFAVRRKSGGSPSRCNFHVVPSVKYS